MIDTQSAIKKVTNEDILDNLLSFVQVVTERFDRLETRMDRLEERMDKIEARMDRLEQRMDKIELRLDIVEHDIGDLRAVSYRQEQSLGKAIGVFETVHKKRLA